MVSMYDDIRLHNYVDRSYISSPHPQSCFPRTSLPSDIIHHSVHPSSLGSSSPSSVCFRPFSPISSFTLSIHLLSGLPLLLPYAFVPSLRYHPSLCPSIYSRVFISFFRMLSSLLSDTILHSVHPSTLGSSSPPPSLYFHSHHM